ncbi:hypothetical protein AB6N23_00310 [Cellulomonas sp. 179-A 9B4 NHS]|uniref:hypothetical protein n=1 Tax=Cellulomonas sp. 179-A 9B4 NHS TaxID=3142379 RepID=UPI0039A3EE71
MRRKPDTTSFAEVVREVREQPPVAAPEPSGVTDPDGNRWRPGTGSITPGQAHALLEQGARAAWDPCGCGGGCGFTWFGPQETTRLIASGTPTVRSTKRHRGNLSVWTTDDGRVLVVAEDAVRWADLMA